ncbi:MAG TPA: (Fe-S)-binding protein [Polyangiaceae bacterium]|jgi:Fe-S oxidoreductase
MSLSAVAMFTLIFAAFAMFAWSASRRWELLTIGRHTNRLDHIGARLRGTWRYAFRQEKMDYYNPAGWAHKLIFTGFVVLLLRTIMLWGRGFYAPFDLWVLSPSQPLGAVYEFAKDCVGTGVVIGTLVFFYYRLVAKPKRMALSGEGLLIIAIIFTMMIADMAYDGASLVLASQKAGLCDAATKVATASQCSSITALVAPLGTEHFDGTWSPWPAPAGSFFSLLFHTLSPGSLIVLARVGFWTHVSLVLLFLNLLPHSKHFHVITAIPNVFARSLRPAGRLEPMAENAEKLMEAFGTAAEAPDPIALPLGVARIEHFSWKAILDFYTCTECGRCSDNCPAHNTGKILSPKHLTLALRDHLYGREDEIVHREEKDGKPAPLKPVNLVSDVIHPDVLWACTTCRACEEQCPVLISYVDKIIDMRRNLVMVRSEFPHELARPFQGMESNGNPWNLSRMDRAAWSDGLGIPTMSEKPTAEVLYWVGCAASYDDRAKKIARATAKLLKQAGVDFAILGQEESCTGDPARRAGNEMLFATLAEGNAATLNGYKDQGGVKTVVTACPHCFNTLKNEYPDFGAKLEVVHHTDFLLGLLAEGKLTPVNPVEGRVVYHDSCYLGRYNGVYDPPREILRRIAGVELVEPEYWTKQRGLCCGAGGAQMWMEEQNQDRVNVKRTLQLLDALTPPGAPTPAGPKTIASACPFCMTMLTDGVKSKNLEDTVKQLDVAELLERACEVTEAPQPLPPEPEAGVPPVQAPPVPPPAPPGPEASAE